MNSIFVLSSDHIYIYIYIRLMHLHSVEKANPPRVRKTEGSPLHPTLPKDPLR